MNYRFRGMGDIPPAPVVVPDASSYPCGQINTVGFKSSTLLGPAFCIHTSTSLIDIPLIIAIPAAWLLWKAIGGKF